ncbi:MAG: hypothetical protein JSS68_09285 [Actinobacteria bacterium]|nr:hypothetical protein [Actinomycetota bacterium]MBS1885516.1 hypothetical protein [Actinomycetota bacterium]
MLLLATQAEPQMLSFEHPNLGRLVQPRHFPRIADTAARGVPWAADNDCFQGLDIDAYCAMLDRLRDIQGCLFVTVPDVVGDAYETARRFERWWQAPARPGLPVALVAQDGLEGLGRRLGTAWPRIDALFIGGSTGWKLGDRARALGAEARRRGRRVHMGRVNSARRIAYAKAIGCDSVDGTKWVRRRDAHLAEGLRLVAAPAQSMLGSASEVTA